MKKSQQIEMIITIAIILMALVFISFIIIDGNIKDLKNQNLREQKANCEDQGWNCTLASVMNANKDTYSCRCDGKFITLRANGKQKRTIFDMTE